MLRVDEGTGIAFDDSQMDCLKSVSIPNRFNLWLAGLSDSGQVIFLVTTGLSVIGAALALYLKFHK